MFHTAPFRPGVIYAEWVTERPGLTALQRLCTVAVMPAPKPAIEAQPDFEASMRALEELVERLEQGDLPLEESLAAFERGVMLTRACQTALKEAEQKVEILLKKAGEPAIEDFTPEDSKAG
jgi:exodeoxyribonuclease VII small subunit